MATLDELRAAVDALTLDRERLKLERATVELQIAGLKDRLRDLDSQGREMDDSLLDAQTEYNRARLITAEEAAFLEKAAQKGGYEYRHSTGNPHDRTYEVTAEGAMANAMKHIQFVGTSWGFSDTKTVKILAAGRAKLKEYREANKPPKRAKK